MKGQLTMKIPFSMCSVFTAVCAFGMGVPALPPSECADTEVSTNFMFSVGGEGGRRLVFSLELQATPTNNVEIAIGHDENCDGYLSINEAALTMSRMKSKWNRGTQSWKWAIPSSVYFKSPTLNGA